MIVLIAPTEDFNRRNKTNVSAEIAAGSNAVIPVDNAENFAVNQWIVVGLEGSQQAEVCQISAVDAVAQTIEVPILRLTHYEDEPITEYRYNQRKFYGSLTEDGAYTELTLYGSPVNIMVNNPDGTLFEYTGDEGYLFFISTYWNSYTSEETDQDESTPISGDDSGRYCSLYAIRQQSGLTENPNVTDGRVEAKRKQSEGEINSIIFERYQLPLVDTVTGANSIPALIQRIAILLAGGYLAWEEEGKDGEGPKYLGEARGLLKTIQLGRQRLIDANYNEYALKTKSSSVQGYPNRVNDKTGPVRLFDINQLF